jgi:hypothetical protein
MMMVMMTTMMMMMLLWNGREEDGNVTSACEEDEGTNCEEGDRDTDW